MSKPLAATASAEKVTIDYLKAGLAAHAETVTCSTNVPLTLWKPDTPHHIQVALDGTPIIRYPLMDSASVRITAWTNDTVESQRLLRLCLGLLLSHPGSGAVGSVRPLTGCLPTKDPTTGAELATGAVRMNLLYAAL